MCCVCLAIVYDFYEPTLSTGSFIGGCHIFRNWIIWPKEVLPLMWISVTNLSIRRAHLFSNFLMSKVWSDSEASYMCVAILLTCWLVFGYNSSSMSCKLVELHIWQFSIKVLRSPTFCRHLFMHHQGIVVCSPFLLVQCWAVYKN